MEAIDFELDSVGSTYDGIGVIVPPEVTSTVVSIASVIRGNGLPVGGDTDALPANGNSINVLKVQAGNFGSLPLFTVTIPAGKTLANYKLVFDAYFSQYNHPVPDGQPEDAMWENFYKQVFFLADTTIACCSGGSTGNSAYQSSFGTDWQYANHWLTIEMAVDPAKAANLTGTIVIAVGMNTKHTSPDNAYYLDNIKLIELP